MNIWDILIIALITAAAAAAVIVIIKKHRCDGGCASCSADCKFRK